MNERPHHRVACECRDGIAALDHVLEHRPDTVHDRIAEATRCLARLRDRLIEAKHDGHPDAHLLERANALLSLLIASEFPLVGLRWDRVKKARDEFADVVDRVSGE
jgi:hypothetical protein